MPSLNLDITCHFSLPLQYSAVTRCKLFHKLLSEHKTLTDEHERVKTELDKTGTIPSSGFFRITLYLHSINLPIFSMS